MKKLLTLLIFICSLVVFSASAQTINFDAVAPHPRLMLKKGDVSRMRELPARSANASKVHNQIMDIAEGYTTANTLTYELNDEGRLACADELLRRVLYLSYAHAMSDDMRYVAAADREMLAASSAENWNSASFEDAAKITMALSIGYDWLYRRLSVRSRSIIGTAIYEKSLRVCEQGDNSEFFNSSDCLNQVCNAGLIFGALATLERSPEYCKELIAKCVESNKKALATYHPDGSVPEGYNYWEIAATFETMLVAALQASLGVDAGIASHEGFMRSAEALNHMVAPSGKLFNYGDCTAEQAQCQMAKYWFAAQKSDNTVVALDEKLLSQGKISSSSLLPLYLIYASSLNLEKPATPTHLWWSNTGEVPMFIYRSGWETGADYFAIKGGKAQSSHAHMDAGSFVYELDGVRWAIDMGGEKSESPFMASAEAHNTLMFNNQPHRAEGKAELLSRSVTTREKQAEIDLSAAFADHAQSVKRRALLNKKNHLTVTDEISGVVQPSVVEWRMATNATAQIVSPQVIMLTQEGKTLYLRLKTRSKSSAKVWQADENTNGVTRVGFVVELRAGDNTTLEVTMSPTKQNVISRLKQTVIK